MNLIRVLRAQAWERSKGELRSMLQTFFTENEESEKFTALKTEIDAFIEKIESDALSE